jgi:hypothetical protein
MQPFLCGHTLMGQVCACNMPTRSLTQMLFFWLRVVWESGYLFLMIMCRIKLAGGLGSRKKPIAKGITERKDLN